MYYLTDLHLCDIEIDDEGANMFASGIADLTNALINNSCLLDLSLCCNADITQAGWVALSNVLRNPNSALEELDLTSNFINDEVMFSFAEALANNRRLRALKVVTSYDEDTNITFDGYMALTSILRNSSSIMSTYHSNHTLERVWPGSDDENWPFAESLLPEGLISLLRLNRDNSESQAARLKIIETHFSGREINMLPFMGMTLSVRPHAIAWMARDNHLYQFLRAMPSLLE
jgi:hypothetical protein